MDYVLSGIGTFFQQFLLIIIYTFKVMSINERGTIIENVENKSLNINYLIVGVTGLILTFIFSFYINLIY